MCVCYSTQNIHIVYIRTLSIEVVVKETVISKNNMRDTYQAKIKNKRLTKMLTCLQCIPCEQYPQHVKSIANTFKLCGDGIGHS